jgi:hypothetical protein
MEEQAGEQDGDGFVHNQSDGTPQKMLPQEFCSNARA